MSEQKIPIPAMLYNAAVGGHVTNSQQIIDENLNREQNDINQETVGAVPYNSTTPNGMGRIVLKKNDNFKTVVEAQTGGNTIFVIKYDFTLTGNVTIPSNCILQFEGGSIKSGSGENMNTITGQNTCIIAPWIGIFYDTLTFAGTWNIEKVIANWFISQNDSAMFNAAIIFAATIAENTWPDYNRVKVEVICVTKTYELTDTIRVSCKINFNGNQATFWAKPDLYHKYAFMIHYNSDGTPSSFIPGAEGLWFGNFTFYNHNTGAYMALVNDGRHIRDIKVFDGYKNIIAYSANYIDQKKISRVWVDYEKSQSNVDYSSLNAFKNNCSIIINLGDNCVLEDINCDVFFSAGATAKINGFMGTIGVDNAFVSIENAHTEAEPLLLVGNAAVVSVKNYHGWRPKLCNFEYNIKSFSSWDTPTSIINLEDIKIGLLSTSRTSIDTDPDYDSYRLVKGQCLLTTKNVFTRLPLCFRDDTSGDMHTYGGSILMLPKHPNGNGYLQNGELYEKGKSNSLIKIEPVSGIFDRVDLHANQSGTDGISIRFVFLADTDAMLFLHKTDKVISSGTTKATFSFNGAFEPPVGTILRVEIGATPSAYTHYYDIPVGLLAINGIFTEIVDVTPVIGTMDCTPIDYTDNDYIKVFSYEKHNYRNVVLDSSVLTLPSATKFNEGDVVSLYNGKRNRNINNTWVEI